LTKICPNCGKENEDDSTFCIACGERLSGLNNINTRKDSNTDNDNNKKIILIGVIAVLIIAIAIVGVFALMAWNSNENIDLFNNNANNNVSTVSSSSIPLSEVYGLAKAFENELQTKDISEISSVEYKGVTFSKPQCLYIFAKAIDMKNKGVDGNINFKSFGPPDDPLYGVKTSFLLKSEYVDMAKRTVTWMENHGNAPNYTGIIVAGSPDFGYDGLVLAFAMVIVESENGSLPLSISW
jgi:hypothetical protein